MWSKIVVEAKTFYWNNATGALINGQGLQIEATSVAGLWAAVSQLLEQEAKRTAVEREREEFVMNFNARFLGGGQQG